MNLDEALAELSPREEHVLRCLWGVPLRSSRWTPASKPATVKQVADALYLCTSRIYQIRKIAYEKLEKMYTPPPDDVEANYIMEQGLSADEVKQILRGPE